MATLNASKWSKATIASQTTHAAARGSTATSFFNNQTNSTTGAEYRKQSGRRSTVYTTIRSFYYFDTSGITGTVTAATINITGNAIGGTADIIVCPSTAFSGDGSTNFAAAEYGNISFNTNYTNEYTGWNNSSNNSITLKSTALSNIQSNDYFICAVLQHDNDYSNSEPGTFLTSNIGINYTATAYLDYTEAASGPANVASFLGVTKANISTINTISLGDISELNGIS
jgi:hypothetical protein